MSETKFEPQTFQARSGPIEALLMTPPQASTHLAVVLPGAGYSCWQPLLHFTIKALLKKRFRVLALDKIYANDPNWTKLTSGEEARKVVEDDMIQVFNAIPEKISAEPHTIVARSLGTYAVACLLEKEIINPSQIVWQTPALGGKWSIMRSCGVRSFGILGTADHYYKDAFPNLPDDQIVVEDADHSMEIPLEALRSIDILRKVTEATEKWLLPP